MNLKNLNKALEKEPGFRIKQAEELIYVKKISSWEESTVFNKELKNKLITECSLDINAKFVKSKDVKKALVFFEDDLAVETVLMKHQGRNTVCVSSQVGCSLGCKFCQTGKMGLKRSLTDFEIVEQVLLFAREDDINNIVFMGMGEPLLNYDNVFSAINILNKKMGIGARHISISTIGIPNKILKLKNEIQINLAISLHAPNNKIRSSIMPVNNTYNIENVLSATDEYIKSTNRKVMIEYTLIKGVNDAPEHARELAKLLRNPLYMVNLIKYNDTKDFKSPDNRTVQNFKKILQEKRINVTERFRFGGDIHAACGQLFFKV